MESTKQAECKSRHCLNCGTRLYDGDYCHRCGQLASTGRLTLGNMGVSIATGLTRINSGFLFTLRTLLLRPWRLIAQYINGRRVRYVAPVQLLLVLVFIWLALPPLIGYDTGSLQGIFGTKVFLAGDAAVVRAVNAIFNYVVTSETLMFVVLLFPAIPAIALTHRMAGVRRFNLAEYIVAALYLSCYVLALSAVTLVPVAIYHGLFATDGEEITVIKVIILVAVMSMAIYKSLASSHKSTAAKCGYVVVCFCLTALVYILILLTFIIIHGISFGKF